MKKISQLQYLVWNLFIDRTDSNNNWLTNIYQRAVITMTDKKSCKQLNPSHLEVDKTLTTLPVLFTIRHMQTRALCCNIFMTNIVLIFRLVVSP